MKTDQQQRLVYIVGAFTLAAIFASSVVAGKYPEYINYVWAGLMAIAVLLVVGALRMIRTNLQKP